MKFEFSGKRAIVAGGSKGIGRSIALGLAEAGADVSICARGADALAKTGEEIQAFGVKAHAVPCDLADGDQIVRYVEDAARTLGGIDILVNNASGFGGPDTDEAWDASMAIDVMATVRASRVAVPYMEKVGGGAIVNISSISGFRPSLRTVPYAAVKAAVINFTSTQGLSLAPKNIRANCIAPGSIEFPGGSWEKRKTENPELYGRILKSIPFGRLGRPEEVANVAMFLLSPLAGWVTGQTLIVDGGQILNM